MQVDLHGYTLIDAKKFVNRIINDCYKNGITELRLLVGYNSGNTLKSYFNNIEHYKENSKVINVYDNPVNSGEIVLIIKKKIKKRI